MVDLIRCSIHVDTPKQLCDVFNKFYQMIYIAKKGGIGCIKSILRIKNGFGQFKEIKKDSSLGYCDIKCNILIEFENIAIIGEVQFLLSFMLKAKRMSHKLYEFERKKEYFYKLNEIISYSHNHELIINKMNHIIAVNDWNKLSQLLLYCDENEANYLTKYKENIISLMKQNKWKKGLRLFNHAMLTIQFAH